MLGSKMFTRRAFAMLSAFVVALTIAGTASAQTRTKVSLNDMGYIADGYDTVAYFAQSKPMKGNPQYTVEHNGAKFMFSSKENMDAFNANPTKYWPQYGGHCSASMAQGQLVKGDPQQFVIHDNKLYLQAHQAGNAAFREKPAEMTRAAETNWKNLNQGG